MQPPKFPRFTWTPRRVAVKFIRTFGKESYDPTLLPSLLSRLDAAVDRHLGAEESTRVIARKEAMSLIGLYGEALAPLSEAFGECLHYLCFCCAFLGHKHTVIPELLERVVAVRNRLAVSTCAMEIAHERHFQTKVVPDELWTAICLIDPLLVACCAELHGGTPETVGLFDQATSLRNAQRQVLAFESSARETVNTFNPAWAAWFIGQKTIVPLARFNELMFFVGVLQTQHRAEMDAMLRAFESPHRRARHPRPKAAKD